MSSTTIRVMVILAAAVLAGGTAWGQSSQPAASPAAEPAVKPFGSDKAAAPAPAPAPAADAPALVPGSQPTTTQAVRPDPCGQMGGSNGMMFAMMGGVVLLFWFMGRGKRKQESSRRDMLANLKKGDKITTIGGIIGTIVDVREDEVIVKIDDDARIHMARWAIRGVGEAAKAENPDQAKKDQDKK